MAATTNRRRRLLRLLPRLWVQIDETGGNYNYLLFDDEAKTKPAGHITTVSPTDWETFPQVFNPAMPSTAAI
jgi:hypothetical protein